MMADKPLFDDAATPPAAAPAPAKPRARRTKAQAAPADPDAPKTGVPRCMEVYDRLFRQKYGADNAPHIKGGKDGKHFKDLIRLWGEDEVVRLLGVFFSTTDARVRSCDYTIGAFYMLAQHLRLRSTRTVIDNRSQRTVDALQRAMGRHS
jgi:hypothetical protein